MDTVALPVRYVRDAAIVSCSNDATGTTVRVRIDVQGRASVIPLFVRLTGVLRCSGAAFTSAELRVLANTRRGESQVEVHAASRTTVGTTNVMVEIACCAAAVIVLELDVVTGLGGGQAVFTGMLVTTE